MEMLELVEIFDAIKSVWKGYRKVKDSFMVRKIATFGKKPFEEDAVENYIQNVNSDVWQRIQDSAVHALTQAEDLKKAEYERNLVRSLLLREITEQDFFRMNFVLTRIFVFDIGDLQKFAEGKECDEQVKKRSHFIVCWMFLKMLLKREFLNLELNIKFQNLVANS